MNLCSIFWALGDETRFGIVEALSRSPRNVSELVEEIGAPQPNVSRHLKALRDRGVIRSRRLGKWIEYSIEPAAMRVIAGWAAGLGDSFNRSGRAPAFQQTSAPPSSPDDNILFYD